MFKISSRLQHTISFLSYIARQHERTVPLSEVASKFNLSQGYLEEIAAQLRRRGIVDGHKGISGGYRLAADVTSISLLEVFRAVHDTPILVDCLDSSSAVNCNADEGFAVRRLWADLNSMVLVRLSAMTLADVSPISAKQKIRNIKVKTS